MIQSREARQGYCLLANLHTVFELFLTEIIRQEDEVKWAKIGVEETQDSVTGFVTKLPESPETNESEYTADHDHGVLELYQFEPLAEEEAGSD